ncbi:MAG: hypothetical protein ACPG8W_01425 [Candidatus Promineifilaceae bacterium]
MEISLDTDQIIAYLHHTMSQSERTAFEARLRDDVALRGRLSDERAMMRKISGGISAELRQQTPPTQMTFAAIAPKLNKRRASTRWRENFATSFVALVALVIISFAVFYSIPEPDNNEVAPAINTTQLAPDDWASPPSLSATPTIQTILTQTVTLTTTHTAPQEFDDLPTIPTRVPTVDLSDTGE